LEEDAFAVPRGHHGRANPAAGRADDAQWMPGLRMLDIGDSPVNLANEAGPIKRQPDERIQRSGGVDVAHPVVPIRVDPQARKRIDEEAREMARVARVAIADRVRHVRQWSAHLALDRVWRE